jgi:hypothetical protein
MCVSALQSSCSRFLLTPGNTLSRSSRRSSLSTPLTAAGAARANFVYEYDQHGPPRFTLLFILATVAPDEDLWPDWADSFYRLLSRTCEDIGVGLQSSASHMSEADLHARRPCFRELRPMKH